MSICPRCKSELVVRDGNSNGRQRHLCKECGYRYTRDKLRGKDKSIKKQALKMYLEGMGFRAIGRILEVGHVSIYRWIRAFGEEIEMIRAKEEVKIVEIDELHTYIGSKKTIVGYGLRLTEVEKNLSTSYLAIEELIQEEDYGIKLSI
jgi:transposase-like protein